MEKIKFTREEMATMIDILNSMITDKKCLSTQFFIRNCPFWTNKEVKEKCSNKNCLVCMGDNMVAFLDIIKDIIIKGKLPVDALTKEQTTKIRVYSNEDCSNNTLAWLALTDEQLRLFNYLVNNGYLTDGINYDECGKPEFETI